MTFNNVTVLLFPTLSILVLYLLLNVESAVADYDLLKIRSSPVQTGSYNFRQIRSSAWLEHYTDNVGVSSSNLLGSTKRLKVEGLKFKVERLTTANC